MPPWWLVLLIGIVCLVGLCVSVVLPEVRRRGDDMWSQYDHDAADPPPES
ncbi:MAG: hypothetical protein JWL97_3786 [Gemmatimonadales bacterium]|nr:hypothetical protein [Gemmatimonadales bacterium]